MTVARTLPVSLASRFSGAQRVVFRSDTASFETVVAERFDLRLRGLAGLTAAELVPLLFPRCRSLHTFGMRTAIDVVWLELSEEGEGEVIAVDEAVGPRRLVRAPSGTPRQRAAALELLATDATALGLGPGTTVRR
jgi:uncharacterized membrane protein (UPF0127 family)